jgi:pilus assembly protein Flp/PilA
MLKAFLGVIFMKKTSSLSHKIKLYLKDESGQTSTEYILLIAVAAMIVFKFKKEIGDKLMGVLSNIFKNMDDLTNIDG